MKVLIASDDAATLERLSANLSKAGFEIGEARTVPGVVRQIELDRRIRLIVADWSGKEGDAQQMLGLLHQHNLISRVEVVVCCEAGDPETVVHTIEMGAREYLIKPYKDEDLLARVNRLMEKIGRTVLIVDDEELMRGLLARIVERDGYFTLAARGAQEALEALRVNKVDVVITDIVMPEMDGVALLKEIRKQWPDIPVLLVTGYSDKYSSTELTEDADGFLTKPFKNVEVLERVNAAMRRRARQARKAASESR